MRVGERERRELLCRIVDSCLFFSRPALTHSRCAHLECNRWQALARQGSREQNVSEPKGGGERCTETMKPFCSENFIEEWRRVFFRFSP